ncbi:MAG TPA: sigma-70 family RNA polymerase sigma factor [Thermoleophilaceae bacterium]
MLGSPRLLSDERLATMAGGSDTAFAVLYRRYDGMLHGYCLSIVRDADDARDALQNAWIKVLVALRRQSRSAPVRPWLFRIVHNEAITVLRRRPRAEPVPDLERSGTAVGADEQAVSRERVAEVVSDLRGLPEGQRAALVMREWADLEYGEIADALATTEGNARQLVFAARTGLQESHAGRGLPCDAIRQDLAHADGRTLRRRRVRAHLSSCPACQEFSVEVRERRREAAAFLPLSPLAGGGLLQSIVTAAGGSAGAGGGGIALGSALAKGAVVAALVTGGVGTAELTISSRDGADRSASSAGGLAERSGGEGGGGSSAGGSPADGSGMVLAGLGGAGGAGGAGARTRSGAGSDGAAPERGGARTGDGARGGGPGGGRGRGGGGGRGRGDGGGPGRARGGGARDGGGPRGYGGPEAGMGGDGFGGRHDRQASGSGSGGGDSGGTGGGTGTGFGAGDSGRTGGDRRGGDYTTASSPPLGDSGTRESRYRDARVDGADSFVRRAPRASVTDSHEVLRAPLE